jgi:hypothetical protein
MPDTNPSTEEVLSSKRQPKQPIAAASSGTETSQTTPDTARQDVHFTMQGKGGVGKSFVAWVLAQWYLEQGKPVAAFDTDPLNVTFSAFDAFRAQHMTILDEDQVNVDGMDDLIERIIGADTVSVVDNGASSFLPIARYLMSNDIASVLADHGRRLVVHTVVVGGQSALDTLAGMVAILSQFPPEVPVVVWVNEHTAAYDADGLSFEETKAYRDHKERIAGVIRLPHENPLTHGRDVRTMMARHLTFAEAINDPAFKIVAKSRLGQVRTALFAQLDRILPAI